MVGAILLIWCPDRKGIVAKVSNFLYRNNGNIEDADQHIDKDTNTFFMRIEWSLKGFKLSRKDIPKYFEPIAREFNMHWSLHFSDELLRVAIYVSRFTHCLYDLLFRYQEGQLKCKIPLILSNHPDAKEIAQTFKIPFYQFEINRENKEEAEKRQLTLLKKERIDLIVLARYTQILTKQFVEVFPNRIINIHHSFLPAFVGSQPYRQAYRRGVKIIGATSHYVTENLDQGPIIEQDTIRITHRDSLEDLKRKGQDLEKIVLSRAVRWHLEWKILVYNYKTVVFA